MLLFPYTYEKLPSVVLSIIGPSKDLVSLQLAPFILTHA